MDMHLYTYFETHVQMDMYTGIGMYIYICVYEYMCNRHVCMYLYVYIDM